MAIETTEYLRGMLPRMIRAAGRRVGDADPEDLVDLVALRDEVDAAIASAIRGQRERHGRSWAEIARGLGTSRQAVQMRYGQTNR
ncbi:MULTISPECIES: hypothetical protein [unclassified Aeromicrobium]|uniref:hypothetical protein n=1 Tax=unclassified Aeromicrobium TaxID=2633570 RepID=UPI00288AD020|nr:MULTISPECIES: hypothetical protein [unclassified Aeromicrobium]